MFKASITVMICGLSLYVTMYRKPPGRSALIAASTATALLPSVAISTSIGLRSARIYCTLDIGAYSDMSPETKTSLLAYYFCFQGVVQLCAFTGVVFFIIVVRKLEQTNSINRLMSMSSSSSGEGNKSSRGMSSIDMFVKRLILFPLLFFFGWAPDALLLFIILVSGLNHYVYRTVINAMAGSTGWAISLSYFYFQIAPKDSPVGLSYIRNSIMKSTAFGGGGSHAYTYDPDEEPLWGGGHAEEEEEDDEYGRDTTTGEPRATEYSSSRTTRTTGSQYRASGSGTVSSIRASRLVTTAAGVVGSAPGQRSSTVELVGGAAEG
jgi:hypothetical protein